MVTIPSLRRSRRGPTIGRLVALGLALVVPGLGATQPEVRAQAMAAIHAVIGDGACDSDLQCGTVAVGTKACGGPELYLAWSSRRVDQAVLNATVANYRSAAPPESAGRVSTCSIVVDPGARCVGASPKPANEPHAGGGSCRLRDAKSSGGLQLR